MKTKLLFICLLSTLIASSQNPGTVRGSVFDSTTGSAMFGVRIYAEKQDDSTEKSGGMTDLEGQFSIALTPGVWMIRYSFVSYQTQVINDVTVKEGEVVILDEVRLSDKTGILTGVDVTRDKIIHTDNSVLKMKQTSVNMIDGISATSFRKMGDGDAASAIKRLPGVSVTAGKYVFIRGLGDRYNKTTLNGVDIPGLDPDRNTIQMDIFPTSVISNMIVNKTFIAELPADFTGGVVDISLKSFPEERNRSISLSAGYNPWFHFNSNYLTYQGSKTDFLGFDDGQRRIPVTGNVPFFAQAVGDPDGPKGIRYRQILESFNTNLAAHRQMSIMDYGFGLTLGNQFKREKMTIGYNAVITYKNSTDYYKDALFARYGLSGDASVSQLEVREHQEGDYGSNNVLLSGLGGLAIKTLRSRISLQILHLQNGESKAGIFDYTSSDQGAVFSGFQHNLEYSQRSLTNALLSGKHSFNNSGWTYEWKLAPTLSLIHDPDIRFTRYETLSGGGIRISSEAGFPERIWRELTEKSLTGMADFAKEFKLKGRTSRLKFGASVTEKERDFVIRTFAFNVRDITLFGNPNEIFAEQNLWPYNGDPTQGTTYEANFLPNNANQFNARVRNIGGYVSAELPLTARLKSVFGLRSEFYTQRYTGQDQLGINDLQNEKVMEKIGFFPSLNLVYKLSDIQNLRFAYGRTVARPSMKELSYAEIYDPISGRTFIGGLFRDANDAAGKVYWDGKLTSTDIHNFDLRWETFHAPGQTVSVSAFYKYFLRPIEIVQYATQAGAFQPRNVGDGQVAGVEIDWRQSLKFIHDRLKNFSFVVNFTGTYSKIKMSATEYQSRVENARVGQNIREYRDMAGQAPYLVNAGLSFDGGKEKFWKGFEVGIYYNVQGTTLQYVGIVDRPDIYSRPFHSLNINSNKTFGKKDQARISLGVNNLLNDSREAVFKSYNSSDLYFSRLGQGIGIQLGFSYNF